MIVRTGGLRRFGRPKCGIIAKISTPTVVPPPPPPPPAPDGSAPAWVNDLTRFDDYVVRLGWTGPSGGGVMSATNNFQVLAPLAGETLCPGFPVGANIRQLTADASQVVELIQRVAMIVQRNVPWPMGVTVYLPAGTFSSPSNSAYDSIGVKVNLRFVGAATTKTWMTAGTTDGTHIDIANMLGAGYINLHGVLRFDAITWRQKAGGSVNKHAFETSSVFPGCFQFVGCEFRWAADAIKMHEAQTNDSKNYALAGGYGGQNLPAWSQAGAAKDTGTSLWLYDCVVRECGGQDSGLKHGLIYALNGNTLRLDQVAVIDTTDEYLGAKAGINTLWANRCLFVNRWNTFSQGRRIDQTLANNNPSRYWGDTLLETQPGAAEVVLKDTQFFARAQQKYDLLSFTANPQPGSSVTINGYTVTFVAANPTADEVLIGASASATVSNFVAMLRASTNPVAQAFDYEIYGAAVILSGKALPRALPTVTRSTSPAANVTLAAGGAWEDSPPAFIYEHLRGKMPFAGSGKIPDYFTRQYPGTQGSWRGIYWNNGAPVTASNGTVKPGHMTAFVWRDLTPTSTSSFGTCSFTGASGAWPSLTAGTFTNTGWSFVEGSGVLAGNRGRIAGASTLGRATCGDTLAETVSVAVDLATIPSTDDGQGLLVKATVAKAWAASSKYAEGDRVASNGMIYQREWMASAPSASGPTPPSGTGTHLSDGGYLWASVAPATWYALTYHRASGQLRLIRQTGAMTAVLAQAAVGSVASARLRFQEADGQLNGRLWALGQPEPTAWTVTAADGTPLAEGKVGLQGMNGATEVIEFDNLAIDSPYPGQVLRCADAFDAGDTSNKQFSWPPIDDAGLTRLPAPFNTTHYWRAWVTLQDASGNQSVFEALATCDARTRCTLATPVPAGFIVPAGSRVYLAPASRAFRDSRLLNPAYHDPAHPAYYWHRLYRDDGTVKEPADTGFNDAFHVRYVDNCSFTYVGPPQDVGGEAPAILKYNSSAYCAYLAANDDEGFLALPPQWNANTCAWPKPTGAGTFTDAAETGNRFFGGTAPSGFRGHQGSDFTDPVTWMFANTSHYCLPSEFRGGQAAPRAAFASFDHPFGPPANGQLPPRGRVFVVDKTSGTLTQGGARPLSTLTTLTRDEVKGATSIHVASATGLAVGHKIEIPLANDPWGLTQADDPVTGRIKPYADTHVWRHVTTITAIDGLVVTLAEPLPDPFPGDGLTAIARTGAVVAATPTHPRPAHFLARFEDLPTATQGWR